MQQPRKRGSTSNMVRVFIPDNTSTTGAGLAGLTNSSTNLVIAYSRAFDNGFTTYSGANIETITTIGTFANPSTSSKVRFKAVDPTNAPGLYELHFHDSATAFGAGDASPDVIINILETSTTALHIGPNMVMIPLVPWDPQDAVRLGLTAIPNVAAGGDGSIMVQGATQTPTLKSLTISNSAGDALTLASTGSNGSGLKASGNGTGDGIQATGGATGRGIHATGGATSGAGFRAESQNGNSPGIHGLGNGTGAGLECDGGGTGPGGKFVGGATSGDGIDITTTSGDGLSILPTAGNGIVATANGTSKHGMVVTGGTAGTSDGLKCVAGAGGVDIRGNQTGNVTGNLSGSVGSVTAGVSLAAAGLDAVTVESGLNARQALAIIASASGGVLAGAATTSVTIAAAGAPATNRITATVDASGNRSSVTLNPPP